MLMCSVYKKYTAPAYLHSAGKIDMIIYFLFM